MPRTVNGTGQRQFAGIAQGCRGWAPSYRELNVKAVERWPRVRPHWRRFRRRLCSRCPKFARLSEPRYLVCSGCGAAPYCSEACQIADWSTHQLNCVACGSEFNGARVSLEEKTRFSDNVYRLSQKDLGEFVLKLDCLCPRAIGKKIIGDGEIELNLDLIDPRTFRELDGYVRECLGGD